MRNGRGFLLGFLALIAGVPLLLGLVSIAIQQFHAPVTSSRLARSVAVGADSAFLKNNECNRRNSDTWTCLVSDQGGSGNYVYSVDVRPGSSCWVARLIQDVGEVEPKRTIAGCVNRFEGGWFGLVFGISPIPSPA